MFLDAFCIQIVWCPLAVVIVFVAISCWLVGLLQCWRSGLFASFQGFGFFGLFSISFTRDHSHTSFFLQFGFVLIRGFTELCLGCVFVCLLNFTTTLLCSLFVCSTLQGCLIELGLCSLCLCIFFLFNLLFFFCLKKINEKKEYIMTV
jgi:hypothetical protein